VNSVFGSQPTIRSFCPSSGGERILGGGGFADASLSIKRDLTQSSHYYFLFVFEPSEVMPRHRTRLVPSQPKNNFQAPCQLS